jgi:hypothetical protein
MTRRKRALKPHGHEILEVDTRQLKENAASGFRKNLWSGSEEVTRPGAEEIRCARSRKASKLGRNGRTSGNHA